eukprot:3584654-Prorocentrum_lima.AAC.1
MEMAKHMEQQREMGEENRTLGNKLPHCGQKLAKELAHRRPTVLEKKKEEKKEEQPAAKEEE